MWKMFGWLGRTVAAGLIVSFLAIWTAGYIVNSYVETLLKQYNLPIETQPMALSGVWGTLWGVDDAKAKDSLMAENRSEQPSESEQEAEDAFTQPEEPSNGADNGVVEGAETETGTGTDAGSADAGSETGTGSEAGSDAEWPVDAEADAPGGEQDGNAADAVNPEGAEETGSGTGPETHGGAQTEEAIITPDELAEARDQLSEEDRNKLFAILVSKLPQEEWQTISTYVEGGLTEDELTDVQQIVAKYLDREQYDELMEILSKY